MSLPKSTWLSAKLLETYLESSNPEARKTMKSSEKANEIEALLLN